MEKRSVKRSIAAFIPALILLVIAVFPGIALYELHWLGTPWLTYGLFAVLVVLLLLNVNDTNLGRILAMLYGIAISLAMPLETVMLPIYAADLFGEDSYNKIQGIFSSVNTAGFALGAPLANLCYDLTGNYNGALYAGGILITAAMIAMQFVISKAHKEQKKAEKETSGA